MKVFFLAIKTTDDKYLNKLTASEYELRDFE